MYATGQLFPKCDVAAPKLHCSCPFGARRAGIFADPEEEIECNDDKVGNCLFERVIRLAFVLDHVLENFDWESNLRLGGGVRGAISMVQARKR